MKRDKNLHPLSWDHHAALTSVVFTRKLIKAGAGDERLQQVAREYAAFYQIGLLPHFRLEEEWLLPRYLRHVSADDPDVTRLLTEHVRLHRLMLEVALALDSGLALVAPLTELTDLLESHVRFEERVLFPRIEAALTHDELRQLGEHLWANAPEDVVIPGGDGCRVKISGVELAGTD
jgi:hemerythrin-like domain-containing protein